MTDRPDAWSARRRSWRVERLAPSLERLPERRPRFSTLGDLPVEGLYGPWDWAEAEALDAERAAAEGGAAERTEHPCPTPRCCTRPGSTS